MDTQYMQIDANALLHAMRALLVIFIILICIINIILLVKQIRKSNFYKNPKLMTIISLAIGDIMMAMFPLVVMARLNFELDLSLFECRLSSASATYYDYLLHFVYGVGLIVLGVEVLIRRKLRSFLNPSVMAVAVGGVPWFLGLIIILPLCMAKIDYIRCVNLETLTTKFTVSVFLPASLALLMLIIFNCVRLPENQQQPANAANFQPTVVNSQHVVAHQETKMTTNGTQSNVNGAGSSYSQATYSYAQSPAPVGSHYPYQPYPQYPPNQQGLAQYPSIQQGVIQYPSNPQGMPQYPSNPQGMAPYQSNQNGIALYPSNQQGMLQYPPVQQGHTAYNTNHVHIVHQMQPGNTLYVPDMRRTELQRLLIISILFFFMVVPFAAIILTTGGVVVITLTTGDVVVKSYSVLVASLTLNWLMVARSCLTPLIMISYSDL